MPRTPRQIGSQGATWVTERQNKSGAVFDARTTVRDPDGVVREVCRSGATGRAARTALRAHLAERIPPAATGALGGGSRVSQLAAVWLEHLDQEVAAGRLASTSVARYRSVLTTHVLPGLGGLTLQEVTAPTADRFLTELGQRKGASLRNSARTVLKAMFGLAVRTGALLANPLRETASVPVKRSSPKALTPEEELVLLERLRGCSRAHDLDLVDLVELMLATGFRIGETLALDWNDIDLGDTTGEVERPCTARIDATLVRVEKLGLVHHDPKSAAGLRTVVLPTWGRAILERRFVVAWRGRSGWEPMQGMEGPVFPSRTGGWRDPSNTHKAWGLVREEIGFGWLKLHALRKTVATHLHGVVSDREVSDQLGHARVSMTQDNYLHRNDEAGRQRSAMALERSPR
jgi:integrase